jgi:hypothetical protein
MVLLKWLILGAAIWLFYRLYLMPNALAGKDPARMKEPSGPDEEEYVDYEEVE